MNNKLNLKDFTTAMERRKALEKIMDIDLSNLSQFSFSEEEVKNKNIENLIGGVPIPVGVAGPLKINSQYCHGEFYLPLATTEGALVASISRGCKAISLGNNFSVMVEDVGITRGAVFKVDNLLQAKKFTNWLVTNILALQKLTEKSSHHLLLKNLETEIAGKNVFVRFIFNSQDAMGMNMATKAVSEFAKIIWEKTRIECVSVAGNFDIDKKPAWLNFLKGRGKKIWAEAVIPEKIVQEVLKTTPAAVCDTSYRKCLLGSILSGSLGFNAHFGNIIAALFCATGQDLAHITEGSLGITTTEIAGQDLHISIYLPDLVVGTVGGGTGLPAQQTALKLLGIPDPKLKNGEQVLKFAEIIGGAVLAGELSLLAALSANDLAKAHERLGRGKQS